MKSNISRIVLTALAAVASPLVVHSQEFRVDTSTTGLELEEPARPATKPKESALAPSSQKQPTEITASIETTFDEKTRTATFVGDVTVKDSQFTLTCEKLTAILRKGSTSNSPADKEAGGLERAVAEGKVLIVQEKPDEKGRIVRYMGKAARVEYDADTGNVTLIGWPQIQQGINTQVATEEGTRMILNKNGQLKTIGGSKTVITGDSGETTPKRSNANNLRSIPIQ